MQSIGRYQVVEKLGQGGMGVVYCARDTLLDRIVAVKVISAPIDQNSELRERFFREARAAGKLSHKNIITIHDLGEHEGQPYLAMEYLEGQDLLARMAAPQRISLRRKVEIATEICEGLDFAHQHGVVHRDIKPANIYITDGGTVKILDFGLARLVTSELTRSNMMMGTINYMAPEQIRGERVDHRADVFSTAVVLYELLSGRRAFEAESFAATLYKILEEVPEPLQQIDASLPPELIRIVERGLAKARDERYQHMSEMVLDLAVYRQGMHALDSPGSGRPAPVGVRTPSDHSSEAPTGSMAPVTTPIETSPPPQSGPPPSGAPASGVSGGHFRTVAFVAVALLALTVAGLAIWNATRSRAIPEGAAVAAPVPAAPTVSDMMKAALTAFEAEDYATAVQYADAVLARDAGYEQARQLRDRARASAATVDSGIRNARALFDKGRFEDASRAAGQVLAVAPGNAEAKRIMTEGAARSRGKGAEEARTQVARARALARSAGAQRLAPAPYLAATAADRDAERLYAAGRPEDATVKFYEASGLFRSAEIAAQNESAAREARARPEPPPAPQKASEPDAGRATPPVSLPQGLPVAPPEKSAPTQVPAPTPPAATVTPPAPSPPPATAPAPAAESSTAARDAAIADLLTRYKSALESRNLDALSRLWPGLSGAPHERVRTQFQQASRISVEIVDPHISGSGDNATVSFIRRYDVVTVEGDRQHNESHATMDVRRSGTSWLIEGIRLVTIR
jgi:serine/threonine protein kinase